MRNRKIVLLVLASMTLTTCKRDIIPPLLQCDPGYSDRDFRKCSLVDYNIDNAIKSPTSNPDNTAEFAYIDADGGLVKYNIHTKEKQTLVDNLDRILTPDWGSSGWIVFSAGWKIWKIRHDGVGLEQLSFNPRDLYPKLNHTGDQLIYMRNMENNASDIQENPELSLLNKMIIIDLDGIELDSVCRKDGYSCKSWSYSTWSSNASIIHTDGSYSDNTLGLSEYDLTSKTNSNMMYEMKRSKQTSSWSIDDLEYHPISGVIFFQDTRGIKTLDPNNGKVRLLKKSCADESYGSFTITSDGKHLIAIKSESWRDEDNCALYEELHFVRMKCDGSDEERIFIP